ncbi:MAG: hypothetical protein DRO14_04400 [Thermoprotei archaeon]|nr:MAG: hypothetical protein DRO14_04400 [Thermoprotei archaeon]
MGVEFKFACDEESQKLLKDKSLAIHYGYKDLADLLEDLSKKVNNLPSELKNQIREFIDAKQKTKEEKDERMKKKYICKATEALREIFGRA